jgi:hypothetical protein
MAIQPIDLQTMLTQLDTVSKNVTHQQQGMHLAAAMHTAKLNQRETEKNTSVKELVPENEELTTVHDRSSSEKQGQEKNREKKQKKENPAEVFFESIRDPNLGTHIDVLG